jgi:hypothetical protein
MVRPVTAVVASTMRPVSPASVTAAPTSSPKMSDDYVPGISPSWPITDTLSK